MFAAGLSSVSSSYHKPEGIVSPGDGMTKRAWAKLSEKLIRIDSRIVMVGEFDGKSVLSHQMPGGGTDLLWNIGFPERPFSRPLVDARGARAGKTQISVFVDGFVAIPPHDADASPIGGVNGLGSGSGHVISFHLRGIGCFVSG